jgi:sterol desaturase/sphingolipid hydroxylase (fatty acid hydroxylase superfamily)
METYWNVFSQSIIGTLNWVGRTITFDVPWYNNYFWGLIIISLLAWGLEFAFPWRKNQNIIRKDFWLDGFYMFFNFFIFAIVISGFYAFFEQVMSDMGVTMQSLTILNLTNLPAWSQLLIFFILLDFVQWFTHVMLHRFPMLWQYHKVHHSVEEMGFAAHLRYHWMENILYKPLKTFGVMILGGFEPSQAFIVHFIAITIGHLNHSNVKITWGPLRYLFNNSVMHLWHHARHLPSERRMGVNFGISLSLWDYVFRTNYIPEDSGEIELGFDDLESFPKDFLGQNLYGFARPKSNKETTV